MKNHSACFKPVIASCAAARQSRLFTRLSYAMLLTILLSLAAVSCSRDKKPDFRDVKWGMTKDEVKKHESAELVKEGNEILTYRLGGDSAPVLVEGDVQVDVEGKPDARVTVEVEKEEPAYDLVYVFGNGKLSMAIVHLRDTLADPAEYLEAFKQKSREISKETGETASGVAEYGESEPKDDPYSDPRGDMRGETRAQTRLAHGAREDGRHPRA